MVENFQENIEKFKRMEKILKLDLKTREDLCNKNSATTIVIPNLK
jgi:hypothetical protein